MLISFFPENRLSFLKNRFFFDYRICASLTDERHYQQRGMTKYRVDRILPARIRGTARETTLHCSAPRD